MGTKPVYYYCETYDVESGETKDRQVVSEWVFNHLIFIRKLARLRWVVKTEVREDEIIKIFVDYKEERTKE